MTKRTHGTGRPALAVSALDAESPRRSPGRANPWLRCAQRAALALAGLLTIVTAGGCADDGLDGLTAPVIEESAPGADLVAVEPSINAVEDALARIVPSLSDPAGAEPLQATLAALQNQLAAGNTNGAAGAVAAVESVIEAYEQNVGPDSPDAPDLDAIRLAIEAI